MAINLWLLEYKENKSKNPQAGETVALIISAYGRALEYKSAAGYAYCDSNELPYPKETIKSALIFAIKNTNNLSIKGVLKSALMLLPDWQDGLGRGIISFSSSHDVPKPVEKQMDAALEVFEEWRMCADVALAEAQKIKSELVADGLW